MQPELRVSEATYEWLKGFAEPFEDTPEDALRKVLALAEQQRQAIGGDSSHMRPPVEEPAVATGGGRRERTAHVLERLGVFDEGTELVLLDRLGNLDPSDHRFRAVVDRPRARQNVRWRHDERLYSISALTERIRDEHGVALPKGGLNGYQYWGLADDNSRSLWEITEQSRETSAEQRE